MKRPLIFCMVISGALLLSPIHLMAEGSSQGINQTDGFYMHQVKMLEARGYTNIRSLPAPSARVSAFDSEGSEVLVTFNPDQGTLRRVDYVHQSDR